MQAPALTPTYDEANKLRVLTDVSAVPPGGAAGTVVVECEEEANLPWAIEALQGAAARRLALTYAASQGVPSPGVSGTGNRCYPVNRDGVILSHPSLADLPYTDPLRQVARYRTSVAVAGKVV